MLAEFLKGFFYFLHGFKLAREPALLRFIWIPLICNILLFIVMLSFAGYGLNIFSNWVASFLPSWLQWLHWLIWTLSMLFSAIILIFGSTLLVNIVAGPFNGILSEKVLEHLQVAHNIVPVQTWKVLPLSFWRQIRFLAYYLPRAILYLIFFIIPIVQLIAAPLWFLFNAWVFAQQYLDYPMDLHGLSLAEMRAKMKTRSILCVGFGSGVVLFSLIPLINFVIVPVSVVGATLLWSGEFRNQNVAKRVS